MKRSMHDLFAWLNVRKVLLLLVVMLSGQYALGQIAITGQVTEEDGVSLPGVNITVKGSTAGTVSDADGNYSIEVESVQSVLVFSFIGKVSQEIQVGSQTRIDIVLAGDAQAIEELVVVGYGQQKKVNLTGAVDVVSDEQIENRSVTNVSEALQGVSPNLNFSNSLFSGEPGGRMSINIRGIGSLTGDYSPYVLVDGIPQDINMVNPNDIETITVLKDAAASAIYGARAPYGVVLITTKKGAKDEKVIVNYSNNISFSTPMGMPHMSNSLLYCTAHDQASMNAGMTRNFSDYNYQRIVQYMNGEITDETWLRDDGVDWTGNGWWSIGGNGNNDWFYILYDPLTMRQKHDVSVRGGGKNSSYFISASYFDQPDELKYGDQFHKRYTVTANLESRATDWLTFNLNTKYIKDHNQYYNTMDGYNRETMYHNFYRLVPFRPLYLPNGEFSYMSNIPMLQDGAKEQHRGSEYIMSLSSTIEPVKGWKTKVSYNYRLDSGRGDNHHKTVYGTNPNGQPVEYAYPISSFSSSFWEVSYNLLNVVSSYTKSFDGHNFTLLAGYEHEVQETNSLWGQKMEVLTSGVPSISTSTGEHYVDDGKSHWATQGFFGRLNYNYKEKYLLEFNARKDASSRFPEESRWGFFPSVSAGYNISKENFWSAIEPVVSHMKIRASWGSLGNQNVPNYLYLPRMGIGTELAWLMGGDRPNYTIAPGLVSANLTWETSTTSNVGLDMGFLNGKLTSSLDLYNRVTTDMFGPAEPLPILLGTGVPQTNNATLQTRGFELIVGWKEMIGGELSYNLRVTLADNVSKVLKYSNTTKSLTSWYEGARIGDIWGLETDGIYQDDEAVAAGPDQSLFWPTWGPGDIHYKDVDGDNKITRGDWTADDHGDYKVIGNNMARYSFGFMAGLEWKGFDFNMFWQGVLKRDWAFQNTDMVYFGFNGIMWWDMNVWLDEGSYNTLDYWRPEDETNILGPNTGGFYPKPYLSNEDYKNKQAQTRYMESAAYLRLKNVSIGYTLPESLTQRVSISKARLFVSGENLLTLTPLAKQIDPEALVPNFWGMGKIHFLRKVYAIGINVTF
ncbi:MAG: TonB-dependent receptor [Bacteroidota bacterium]